MRTDDRDACLAAYDAWAATYDAIDNPLIAQAAVVLDARAAWLAGARVLELGCGTGRNAVACLAAGASTYVGVDASPGMLARARERVVDPRASWIEADLVAGAARASGAFDVVLVCLVLEHVEATFPVLAAAAAELAPGGKLFVIELHASLHDRGVGANFEIGGCEVRIASFRHEARDLLREIERVGLRTLDAVDHVPSPAALARSAKLARYAGTPVLLELVATKGA